MMLFRYQCRRCSDVFFVAKTGSDSTEAEKLIKYWKAEKLIRYYKSRN